MKCLDYIRRQQGAAFSVKQWIRDGKGVLFLPYLANQIAAVRSVISTWMRLAIFETMSIGEGDHKLWFSIDDLDALGMIDGLPDALVRLRRFGGRCVLGFQSIGQVTATFGRGPADAMVENCGNSLILRSSASEGGGTAKFASTLIGDREVTRSVLSDSRSRGSLFSKHEPSASSSVTRQIAIETAILPSEIEQLPDREGYLKFASNPLWMRVVFPVVRPAEGGRAVRAKQTECC